MQVPRHKFDSAEGIARVSDGLPVVLTNCPLSEAVSSTWNFEYMSKIFNPLAKLDVYTSNSTRFQYWDNSKNDYGYSFVPPTMKENLTFREFVNRSSDYALYEERILIVVIVLSS